MSKPTPSFPDIVYSEQLNIPAQEFEVSVVSEVTGTGTFLEKELDSEIGIILSDNSNKHLICSLSFAENDAPTSKIPSVLEDNNRGSCYYCNYITEKLVSITLLSSLSTNLYSNLTDVQAVAIGKESFCKEARKDVMCFHCLSSLTEQLDKFYENLDINIVLHQI